MRFVFMQATEVAVSSESGGDQSQVLPRAPQVRHAVSRSLIHLPLPHPSPPPSDSFPFLCTSGE